MKKWIALVLAVAMMCLTFAACTTTTTDTPATDDATATTATPAAAGLKVGFIFLHDENSTYDKNFIDAAKAACEKLGVEYVGKTNIPETNECYETAADMAESGCSIVFADSFGHESYMLKAAKEFPDVEFCHATGTTAHTEKVANFHNAFASIYEGRYLAGIAAGMKLNEMIEAGQFKAEEAKMGYVGAFTYAEVISGFTSFYLGAKSVCPTVTMDVQFTGSWYDETAEKEAATTLISGGAKLISGHADSMGAPTACESANIPNVFYNGSTIEACPNTYIIASRINWEPYFEYIIGAVTNGTAIDTDWSKGLAEGSVELLGLNDNVAAAGTAEAIEAAKAELIAGTRHVFDTTTFTVGGKALDSYMADVDTDADYTPDTEAIAGGYFHESEYRSAPYFDLRIDGITLLYESY
ncbi:MAG: BMP family ABC transporter substrate-binding protein [Clostridia bacterium]|nr:BMP family ABC transporter substrate-binding protein [Clostridia bacterium]